MRKSRVLIIEDEKLNADHLKILIGRLRPDYNVLTVLESVKQSVDWLEANDAPDLILLDIHLADDKSFEIFRQIEVKCAIIFTTAYDQYAIKAFKVNSIDYLLKPIGLKDLEVALEKFEGHKKDEPKDEATNRILEAIQEIGGGVKERFMVKSGEELCSIKSSEIAYFYADSGIVILKTDKRKFAVDYSLDELDTLLDSKCFFRVNRKTIVSIDALQSVNQYFNHRLILKLDPGLDEDIIVSRERVGDFKKWMDQ